MKKFLPLTLLFLSYSLLLRSSPPQENTRFVDPMIGTDYHGHTFPGATTPFGSIQLSPDTRTTSWEGCSGYYYPDSLILGFSHTHYSGTGAGGLGDIALLPLSNRNQSVDTLFNTLGQPFRHSNEKAEPGYYRVMLENGITAHLTCTQRVGMHQYDFPSGHTPTLLVNLGHGISSHPTDLYLEVVDRQTLKGYRAASGGLDGTKKIWFTIRFSRPYTAFHSQTDGKQTGEKARGTDLKALIAFDNSNTPLWVKVSLSRVDSEGADKNLVNELPGWDFEATRKAARRMWEKELSKIEVEGGTETQRRVFYTALYHTMIHPNMDMDVDHRFRSTDGKVYTADGYTNYSTFSLWDTFRALHPLFTLIEPNRVNQFIRSFLQRYRDGGLMTVMEFSGFETFGMIGYHSLSVIADAYVKGIRDYDTALAYEAMKHLADYRRQTGKEFYLDYGYIPYELENQAVSKTLEYAYDDWCVTRLANDFNPRESHTYAQRGQFYRRLFSPEVGFMRGKNSMGQWKETFTPASILDFTEGNAYQFTPFVPQDFQGLIHLTGGDDTFDRWLDRCFATSMDENNKVGDMTGAIGQYIHGNEPSHHMAYLYHYIGKPWKGARRIDQIRSTLYDNSPDGLCGNEDCGQMSAWYVLSAMGIYPTTPGMDYYVIGTPMFSKVTLHLESGKSFVIESNRQNNREIFVQSATLNGKPFSDSFLKHAEIAKGGKLTLKMTDREGAPWGTKPENRPYSEPFAGLLAPDIVTAADCFMDSTYATLSSTQPGVEIRYTVDGSEPTVQSILYTDPVTIARSCTLRARCFKQGCQPGYTVGTQFTKLPMRRSVTINATKPGLTYHYLEGLCNSLSEMTKYPFIKTGVESMFSPASTDKMSNFAFRFDGYLLVPQSDVYTIYLTSVNGSRLELDGEVVIDNDGAHRIVEMSTKLYLEKGMHPIAADYFQRGGKRVFFVEWASSALKRAEIAPQYLFHAE